MTAVALSDLRARCVLAFYAVAAAVVIAAPVVEPASAQTDRCLTGAVEVRAAAVPDPYSVTLEDGRVLRVAGIESFALLSSESDPADTALHGRLAALVNRKPLQALLVGSSTDRYGRHPALLVTGEAIIQESLAAEGMAVAFAVGAPLPCFERILAAEAEARRKRRGYWAELRVPGAYPQALAARVGRFAIFEGTPISVGNRPGRTYLNFGAWWARDVTVEIAARDRAGFGGEVELAKLAGRRARVRGFVEERSGPAMVVRSPMQIELLDAPDIDKDKGP